MKNDTKAIKLHFSKKVRSEFLRMSGKIVEYLNKITPKNQVLTAFTVHDYEDDTADVFKIYLIDGVVHMEKIVDFRWSELEENIPGLADFCEKYSLEKSFTLGVGHDVPPHRHYYTLNSMWSISMFVGDSPGTIQFCHKKDDAKAGEISLTNLCYNDWISTEKIPTQPGDFYSLRTWSWHSWQAENPKLHSLCTIFYMKNTTTVKSVLEAIKHIEQY